MLEESGIHTIHIVGEIRKGMNNTQTRSKNELNLTMIYTACITKKWDQNEKGDENSPQDTKITPQQYQFFDILINQQQ